MPLRKRLAVAVLVMVAVAFVQRQGFSLPSFLPGVPDSPAPTAATYVYEKDDTAPPSAVLAAIDKLNRAGKVLASKFDADTKDGDGDVPDQYVVPLKAATEAGLPALVVTAGDVVLKVVKAPTTAEQVTEAVE